MIVFLLFPGYNVIVALQKIPPVRKISMKKVSFFSLIILLLLPLASCSSPRKDEKLSVTGIYFDTVIQIDAWGVSTSVLGIGRAHV